jgi:polar amino acid transport system substrate-binding protein
MTVRILPSCLLAAALLPGLPARAQIIDVTVYADEGYPPYSYAQQGKAAGIYPDIARAAFARMRGYRVALKPVPWKRGMAMLEKGTALALLPPYYNTRDEPWTWPYSLALLDEHVVAVCSREVVAKRGAMAWPAGFYGLRIGNNAGFIVGGEAFEQAIRQGKVVLEEARDTRSNVLKLGLRRIDCYINDRRSIQWTRDQLKREGLYDEGGKHARLEEAAVIGREQGFLGFTDRDKGRFPYKTDFLKQFNTIIYQMRRTGEIDRIAQDFFKSQDAHAPAKQISNETPSELQ